MKSKRIRYTTIAIALAILPWLGTSCNDLPTEVGIPIDTLEFYSLNSVDNPDIITDWRNESLELPVVYGTGSALLGNQDDFTNSTVFLAFEIPPDTLGNLPESQIINPRLVLHFDRYAFGEDTLSNFVFDVVKTNYEIPIVAKWDWAFDEGQWPDSKRYDLNSDVLARYDSVLPLADTTEVTLDLSEALIKGYLETAARDSDTVPYTEGNFPYGMALVPSTNTQHFRRLYTSIGTNNTLNPKIRFEIPSADTLMTIEIDAAISGQLIKPSTVTTVNGEMIVGSGVRRRSQLYFDLSALPEDADIVSASLWLYNMPERNSFGNIAPDSLIIVDSLRNISDSLTSPGTYTGRLNADGELYVPTLSAFMNGWNFADGRDTLTLLPIRPVSRLDRLAFHSPDTQEPSKRPKLVIIYQKRPGI